MGTRRAKMVDGLNSRDWDAFFFQDKEVVYY